jgi:hypothetical protein
MKTRTARLILAAALLSGAAAGSTATAQTPPEFEWLSATPCYGDVDRSKQEVFDNGGFFMICFEYEKKHLRPGMNGEARDIPLKISAHTRRDQENLTIETVSVQKTEDHPGVEVRPDESSPPQDIRGPVINSRTYHYRIIIDGKAKPLLYRIKLAMKYRGEMSDASQYLPVGTTAGRRLEVNGTETPKSVACWTGHDCAAALNLVNTFPYYDINIRKISVSSEPAGLVEDATGAAAVPRIGRDGGDAHLPVPFRASSMSLQKAFLGFGVDPKLVVRIEYDDTHERVGTLTHRFALDLKPNVYYLFGTLLVGAFLGTVIRFDLRRLERDGYITRRQKIKFAAGTAVVGVIVSVIAVLMDLRLVVFQSQSAFSVYDPRVLLFIGFVGTIGGIPLLYSLLKLPSRESDPAQGAVRRADNAGSRD